MIATQSQIRRRKKRLDNVGDVAIIVQPASPRRRPRPKTKTKTRKKPPNRSKPGLATELKNVVLIGESSNVAKVKSALGSLRIDIRCVKTAQQAIDPISWNTIAFVVIPPFSKGSGARTCKTLSETLSGQPIPIFALQLNPADLTGTKALYRNGATTVFDWPEEKQLLVHAVGRVLGFFSGKLPDDRELAKRVRNKLRQEVDMLGKELTVLACQGTVVLGGQVDALWKVHLVERLAGTVQGVRDVVTTAVRVHVTGIPDRKVGASVRSVLKNTLPDDHARSIAVSVKCGSVTVAGSVDDKAEMLRALDLIEHVRGVRHLSNMLTVAPKAAQSDRKIAKRVSDAVSDEIPEAEVSVSSFGGAVVLRGNVSRAADVGHIKKVAIRYPGVQRVINKLNVAHI